MTKMFYESAFYKQYVAVNQRFANAVISDYRECDISKSTPLRYMNKFDFFMHIAFPSSEIFCCLSVCCDLLSGLVAANLVGLQTPNYARHSRQTVSRILAFEALPKTSSWARIVAQVSGAASLSTLIFPENC
jgi:trehalose-6-phosphate synthase